MKIEVHRPLAEKALTLIRKSPADGSLRNAVRHRETVRKTYSDGEKVYDPLWLTAFVS